MFSAIEFITQDTKYVFSRFHSLRNSYRSLLGDFDDQFVNLTEAYPNT